MHAYAICDPQMETDNSCLIETNDSLCVTIYVPLFFQTVPLLHPEDISDQGALLWEEVIGNSYQKKKTNFFNPNLLF